MNFRATLFVNGMGVLVSFTEAGRENFLVWIQKTLEVGEDDPDVICVFDGACDGGEGDGAKLRIVIKAGALDGYMLEAV